jgi:dTDP-4-dehydrorhamnose reductase
MKVLVLGGDGLLGHQLLATLSPLHETRVTLRRELSDYKDLGLFTEKNAVGGIDVREAGRVRSALAAFRPDAVVNTVAIVPQRADGADVAANLEVNAYFPHRLARMCREVGAGLIHISTDSVFSGERGDYREADRPDPIDLYGRAKLVGEVAGEGVLVLRTALVGPGLTRRIGLIDWFLQQQGRVNGYRGAIFSGLTAKELARVIERLVSRHPQASGLYHVGGEPISKHDLLMRLRDLGGFPVEIVPDDKVRVNRTLDSSRFRATFSYAPPSWNEMLQELAGDLRVRAK